MTDPFETLGVPPRYDLDPRELHRRFLAASAASHPDRFSDPLEASDAAERLAAINEAHRLLRDPAARAEALLRRLAGGLRLDDAALPPALLAEVMEAREKLEEATAAGDRTTLAELAAWADEQRRAGLERVAAGLARVEDSAGVERDEAPLRAVQLELNALRYFQRMIDAVPPG